VRPLTLWLEDAIAMTAKEFVAKHPYPFVVWWTEHGVQATPVHNQALTIDRMVLDGPAKKRNPLIDNYLVEPLLGAKRFTLGTNPDCGIVVVDSSVSRQHAELALSDKGWTVRDTNSTAGTYVNDEPPTATPLASGDRITLGTVDLLFLESRAVYDLISRLELF
jgi:hypothetical protein